MKRIKNIVLALFCVTLVSSCNDDDGFYNAEFVSIPNLVDIETEASYAVNDYLYLNAYIDRLQDEPNQTSPLDLRKSTGNAPSFNFTYSLEKKVGNDWELVELTTNNTIIDDGTLFSGGFYAAYANFDTTLDRYQFRAGIKLETAGEYRLSFGYNSSNSEAVELRSDSEGNNIFLNITSTQNDLNGNGYYSFVVN